MNNIHRMAPFWISGKYFISSILFLMFILEMVIVVWAARDHHDHSKLLDHFGRVPEKHNNEEWQSDRDRVRYWRWKNRNRLRNRRARMGLAMERLNKQPGQKKSYKPGGPMRKHIIQTPPEPEFMNITESMESCCPTVFEVIEPTSGRNRAGHFVELYRDDVVKQYFYEYSCKKGIKDEPCRFLENRHSKQSRCTQQRTYTYALIRSKGRGENGTTGGGHGHGHEPDHSHTHTHGHYHYHDLGSGQDAPSILLEPQQPFLPVPHQDAPPWHLDYISIRSGCACEVVQTKRKRMFKRKGG